MENMKDYTLWEWFKRLVSGYPHIRIFPGEYIDRWHLIPRNNKFNIYLHKYYGGDVQRAPHDHPWWNATRGVSHYHCHESKKKEGTYSVPTPRRLSLPWSLQPRQTASLAQGSLDYL